jgi:hypothetical protein
MQHQATLDRQRRQMSIGGEITCRARLLEERFPKRKMSIRTGRIKCCRTNGGLAPLLLPVRQTVGPSDRRAVGPSDRRTVGPSDRHQSTANRFSGP